MSNSISAAQSVGQQPVGRIGNLTASVNQSVGREINSSLFDLLFQIQVNVDSSQSGTDDSGESLDPVDATVSSTESSDAAGENEVERSDELDAEEQSIDELNVNPELLAFLNAAPVEIEEALPETLEVAEIDIATDLGQEAEQVALAESVDVADETAIETPVIAETVTTLEDDEVVATDELTVSLTNTGQEESSPEDRAAIESTANENSRRDRSTDRQETEFQPVGESADLEDSGFSGEESQTAASVDSGESDRDTAERQQFDVEENPRRNRRAERLAENRVAGRESSNLSNADDPNAAISQSGQIDVDQPDGALSDEPFPATEIPEIRPPQQSAESPDRAALTENVQPNTNVGVSVEGVQSATDSASRQVAVRSETTVNSLTGLADSALRSQQNRTANKTAEPKTSLTQNQQSRLLQRVLRGFESLGGNDGRVKIRLHPESLGAVQLSLEIRNDELTGRLEVETIAARDALTANLSQLENRLKEQNITLKRFEVIVSDESALAENRSQFSGEFGNGQQRDQSNDPGRANSNAARWRHNLGRTARSAPEVEPLAATAPQRPARRSGVFDVEI